jgi:hypothetical protein
MVKLKYAIKAMLNKNSVQITLTAAIFRCFKVRAAIGMKDATKAPTTKGKYKTRDEGNLPDQRAGRPTVKKATRRNVATGFTSNSRIVALFCRES